MEPLWASDPVDVGGVRVFARLGSGGFGQVFLGRNRLQEWVAVKVLHPSAISGDGLQRFAREARATARVDSDFLAAVQEISISADPAFIVSRFIPGPTLAEAVRRPGQITGPEIEALAVGLLAAMDQLAAVGVTHRDIKPANIILGEQGPVLVDLGIAKSDTETTLTVAGAVAGTPSWMAPEQATGTDVGPPADVWAWGRCLTWITQQPGTAPLPDSLSSWVAQALSDTPASRPTAARLLEALAPDGAKDFVSARWGRLGGYAVGRRDALTDMLQTPPTLLDGSGNEPTRRYTAPAEPTPAPAPPTPTPSPPIIVQAPPPRSQAALITAIVVVGVLLIAGIAGAAYFLRPTTQPIATQTIQAPAASPAPTVTVSTTPRPAPTKTITANPRPVATKTVTANPAPVGGQSPRPATGAMPFLTDSMIESTSDAICYLNPNSMPPLVGPYSDSSATRIVQIFAVMNGINPGPIDGEYGPKTVAAVMQLQRLVGVIDDGQVGPITWGAIQRFHCGN